MDLHRIASFDKESFIAVPGEKVADELVGLSPPNRRASNFITIKMQDWEDRSIAHRINKLHTLPATLKRACFCLSIAHDGADNQLGVIESRAQRIHEHIS